MLGLNISFYYPVLFQGFERQRAYIAAQGIGVITFQSNPHSKSSYLACGNTELSVK